MLLAPQVGKRHYFDPNSALEVAKCNLQAMENHVLHVKSVGDDLLLEGSQDFGLSLRVLHYVPDTEAGIKACLDMLKLGASFLIYLLLLT